MNTLASLVQELAAGINNVAKKPNIYSYKPNPGAQTEFHKSISIGRLLIGSNRSGKTYGGVTEDCWWALGTHPYQKTPEPPTYGRIVTVDRDRGIDEIIIPKLRQFLPPSSLVNGSFDDSYSKSKKKLTLTNGSTIELMTHNQDLDSFAGTPRHWVHFDEEPPKAIYVESKARLLDYNGHWWITMTPVQGVTWVTTDIVEEGSDNLAIFYIDIRDNPHISEDAIRALSKDLDSIEEDIRIKGKIVPRGGLVFKNFDYDTHVITSGRPALRWEWWRSIDAGLRNQTAIYWHAVTPDGIIVTFFEHYKSEWTVAQHATYMKQVDRELGKEPYLTVGDPAMSQRNQITGTSVMDEYRKLGIAVIPGKRNVDVGIDKMNEYLRQNKWYITANCVNLIKAIRKYGWKTHMSPRVADRTNEPEKPQKKDDHGPDSCRYFFSFMPSLNPDAEPLPSVNPLAFQQRTGQSLTVINKADFPWRVDPGTFNVRPPEMQQKYELGFGEVL